MKIRSDSMESVSYTLLDVYKRQVQSGTTAFKPVYAHDPIEGFSALCAPWGPWMTLDPEALQRFYYRRLRERDVLLLTSAWVMDATLENGSITQLLALTREGSMQVEGDVFIDATGDGDVAALCAVPYTEGREEDGDVYKRHRKPLHRAQLPL